jgi:hypothetical protein
MPNKSRKLIKFGNTTKVEPEVAHKVSIAHLRAFSKRNLFAAVEIPVDKSDDTVKDGT